MRRWLIIGGIGCGGLLVLVLLLVILLAAIGANNQKGPAPEPGSTAPEKKTAEKEAGRTDVGVGETATLRTQTLVVNEVERDYLPPNNLPRPKEGEELVRVNVTITNTSNSETPLNPPAFKLEDSSGVQRNWTPISQLPNALSSGSLAPGGTTTANIVLAAPRGDQNLTLVYTPIGARGESARVNLS